MPTTVLDISKSALRLLNYLGLNETPSSTLETDVREVLNHMLASWLNDGLAVHQTERQTFACIAGTTNYAIGSGATWNGNRPIEILDMYVTDSSSDFRITAIRESDYNCLTVKSTQGKPYYFFYNQSFPNGTVYLYPTPEQAYNVTLTNKVAFTEYTAGSDEINLPPGYLQAIKYNLAVLLAPELLEDSKINPFIVSEANRALSAIKSTNIRPKPIKRYHSILTGEKYYNIYTGQYE